MAYDWNKAVDDDEDKEISVWETVPKKQVDNNFLSNIAKGFASGNLGILQSEANFAPVVLGTDGSVGKYLEGLNQNVQRSRDWSWNDIKNDPWGYATDPNGLTYGASNQLGSSAQLLAQAALIEYLFPSALGAAATGTTLGAKGLSKLTGGLIGKNIAGMTGKELLSTNAGKALATNQLSHAIEGVTEGLSAGKEKLDETGDVNQARATALKNTLMNELILNSTGVLETNLYGNMLDKLGKNKFTMKAIPGLVADESMNAVQQMAEEGTQNQSSLATQNKAPYSDIVQPWNWTPESKSQAMEALIASPVVHGAHVGGIKAVDSIWGNKKVQKNAEQDTNKQFFDWASKQDFTDEQRNEIDNAQEYGTDEDIEALKKKYGYNGQETQEQPKQTSRQTPVQEGIEDFDLSKTNANLKGHVDMLNAFAYNTFGKDMTISGGARSPEHNAEVNGHPNSEHLYGEALDIDISNFSPEERQQIEAKAKEMGFNTLYHDAGTGEHLHLGLPKEGGFADGVDMSTRSFVDLENEIGKATAGNDYLKQQLAEFDRQLAELNKDEQPTADTIIKIDDLQKEKAHTEEQIKSNNEAIKEMQEEQDKLANEDFDVETADKAELKARSNYHTRSTNGITRQIQRNNKNINDIQKTIAEQKGKATNKQKAAIERMTEENQELIERLKAHRDNGNTVQEAYNKRFKAEDEAQAKAKAEEEARKNDPYYGKSFNELADVMAQNKAKANQAKADLKQAKADLDKINKEGAKGDLMKASELTARIADLNNAISQVQTTNKQIGDTMANRPFNVDNATETHLKARAQYLTGAQNKINNQIVANNKQIAAIQARSDKSKNEQTIANNKAKIEALNNKNAELRKALEGNAAETKTVADKLAELAKQPSVKPSTKPAEQPTSEGKVQPEQVVEQPITNAQKGTEKVEEASSKEKVLESAKAELKRIASAYEQGFITQEEAKKDLKDVLKRLSDAGIREGYADDFKDAEKRINKAQPKVEETPVKPTEAKQPEETASEEPESVTIEDNPEYYKIQDITKDKATGLIARLKNALRTNNIKDNSDIPQVLDDLTGKTQLSTEFKQYNLTDQVEFVKNAIEQFEKQLDSLKSAENKLVENDNNGKLTPNVLRPLNEEHEQRTNNRLIAQNKNGSESGKSYRGKVGDLSGSLKDNVINIKASVANKTDNPLATTITVEEYQKAAIDSANRDAGIQRLLKAKVDKALNDWVENSSTESVKEARKRNLDRTNKSQIVEDVKTLVEKLLRNANIEALDNKTLFDRSKTTETTVNGKNETEQFIKDHIVVVDATPKNASGENKTDESERELSPEEIADDLESQAYAEMDSIAQQCIDGELNISDASDDIDKINDKYDEWANDLLEGNDDLIFKVQNRIEKYNDRFGKKMDKELRKQNRYKNWKDTVPLRNPVSEPKPTKPIDFENAINYDVADKNPGAIKAVFEKGEGKPAEKKSEPQKPLRAGKGRAKATLASKIAKKKPIESGLVDHSKKAELQARLRQLTTGQANSMPMFNPELISVSFQLGVIYIEEGATKFRDWGRRMVADIGENVIPFLRPTWNTIHAYKGKTFDEDIMQAVLEFTIAEADEGKSKEQIIQDFTDEYDEEYLPYVDAAYAGWQAYPDDYDEAMRIGKAELANEGYDVKEDNGNEPDTNGEETSGNTTEPGGEPQNTESDTRGTTGKKVNVSNSGESTQGNEETSNAGADNRPSKSVGGKPSENVSVPDENAGTNGNGGTNDTDIREGDSGNQGDERIGLSGEKEGNSGRNNDVTRVENERFSILPNGNYHVNDVNEIAGGTEAKRFAANIEALHILKAYQEEGIEPTPEQKHILAQYTGWGSFKNDSTLFGDDYDKLDDRIKEVLTKDQWLSVKKNTDSQYFTPGYVTKYIWDLAKHFGFKKGSILEPSMGVGNFFATMPVDAESDSVLTGVEIDDVAGQISKILYPDAHINVMPYEKYLAANNSHDLIVGNVPFYNGTAADGQYDKYFDSQLMIHDYFFVKGVNQLRPGGIMIAISSHGTFDKVNDEVRRYLGERAELVGAIRLPNTTFKGAGTRELTDIIILKKRPYELDRNLVAKEPWVHVGENEISGLNVRENQYFIEHPEMVAGEISSKKDQYGKPTMVVQANNVDAVANLNNIIEKLPKDIMKKTEGKGANEYKDANTQVGQNAVYVSNDGQLVQKKGTQEVPVPNDILANKARKADRELAIKVNKEKIQSILDINEKYDKLLEADRNNAENADELRKQARGAVEAHLKKYGYKNGFMKKVLATKQETDEEGNKSKVEYTKTVLADELQILYNVGDFSKVQKLAFLADENGNVAAVLKHKTFKKSTLNSKPSVQDSYLTQVYDGATTLDMDKLAKDADTTKEKAIKELIDNNKIYQLPDGSYQPTHIYIGGNVVQKLKEAQFAYDQGNKAMERNIKALKEARPEIVPASSISVSIGAPWVKGEWYAQFIKDMAHDKNVTVLVNKKKGEWDVFCLDPYDALSNAYAEQLTGIRGLGKKKIGNSYANLGIIIEKMMNKRDMVVKKEITNPNNPKETIWVKDDDATKALGQAIKSLNGEFNMWLFERDYDRRNEAQTLYNDTINAIASPKYDGSGMEYEGLSTEVDGHPQIPMEHQYNAVLQGLVRGRIGCYYEAGTGKTMIMAMLCHELKRTGKVSKPLVIADNRNCAIVADDFQKMYPEGKYLFIPPRKDDPVGATLKIGAINAEDWDAVIIPHSMVKYISFPKEIIMDLRHEELEDMQEKIIAFAQEEAAAAEAEGKRPGDIPSLEDFQLSNEDIEKIKNGTYKESETPEEKQARKQSGAKRPNYSQSVRQKLQAYKKILVQIEKQAAAYDNDESIKFDKCGFDAVMVDEVHEFRNVPKSSSHSQVKGMPITVSTEGSAMTSVAAYINNKNNDKGMFLFSGTMITNSLPEIHTMMRWAMPDVLRESGIYNLDDFLNSFATASVEYEPGASGELEPINRLRAFNNLPELKRIASMDIAIKRTADLPEYQPRKISTGQTAYSEVLTKEELDEIENGRVPDNQQPIGLPSKKQINIVIPNSKRLEAAQEEIKYYARMIRESQGENANPELRDKVKNLDMNIKLQTISPLIGISLRNLSIKLRDLNTSKTTEVVSNVAQEYKSNDKACQVIFLNYGWGDESSRTSTTLMPDKSGRHLTVRTKRKYTLRPYKMANDIINRLVNDYGIPREQIAVVNKATATEKAKIAERMKTGEIRIVIGSTKSLSTGINMQTNLRAVHFMQPLWLPGEYDQALKRAIRLGNRWNQVHVYHYITQGLDGKMYNAMTVKGAMIDSFTDSQNSQRTLESDALAIGSQNEMFESLADAVGDYRVLQQKQIQDKVDTYEKLEKRFASNQSEAKMKLAKLSTEIPEKKKYIEGLKDDYSEFGKRQKEAQEAYKEKEADIKKRQEAARKAVADAEEELKAAKALKKDDPKREGKVAAADEKLKQLKLERNAVNTEFTELPQDEFAVEFVNPKTGERSVETDRKGFESRIKTVSTVAKGTKYEHNYAKYLGFNVEYNQYKDTYDITGTTGNIYTTKGTNGGSLKSRLNYLTTDIDLQEAGLNRLETNKAAYEDELKQQSPYIDLLRQYQKALKDIIQDQRDNPVPPPEWFTIKAPVGLPVTYDDDNKKGIIDRVSTRNDTYSIILEDIDSGEMVMIPANQVFLGPNNPILTDEDMKRKPNEKLYDTDDENPDTIDAEVEEIKAIIRNYFEEGSEYPGAINALYTDRNDDGPLKPYTKHIDPNTGDITVTWDELNTDVWAEDFPQQLDRLAKAFGLEKPKYKVQTGYLTYKFPNTGEVVKSGKNEVPVHEKQANAFLKALKNYGFGIAQQQYIVDENGKVIDNPNPPDTRFDIEPQTKSSTQADKAKAQAIISMIQKAGIDVITDKAEMERVLGESLQDAAKNPAADAEFFKTSKGEVYGFMKNGKIYLDPDLLNPNTPVHEYTHLWDKVCQKRNPALWRKGVAIMKQTPLWDEVKNNPAYANIKDDVNGLASEVHARLTGENAEKVLAQLEDTTPKGVLAKLKAWLKGFWYYTKDVFKKFTDADIEKVTPEDWANMPMADIQKGTRLNDLLNETSNETVFSAKAINQAKEQVRKQYQGTKQWLKAPNGKDTNLTEEQWLTVRTPQFKQWFGDWENDPKNASKVVDKNGEPLVQYHGSRNYGFDTFETNKANGNHGSHFGSKEVAKDFDFEGYNTYQVFLNIRNPWHAWDYFADNACYAAEEAAKIAYEANAPASKEIIDSLKEDYPFVAIENYKARREAMEEWRDENDDGSLENADDPKVDEAYRKALKLGGYDGVEYQNMYEGDTKSTSWVVQDANNIKSATENNGNFSKTDNNIYLRAEKEQPLYVTDLKEAATKILPIKAEKNYRHTEDMYDKHAKVGLIHNNGDVTGLAGIIGMYLDNTKRITSVNSAAKNEILSVGMANAQKAMTIEEFSRYTALPEYKKIRRGVASFMRLYSRDKDKAEQNYPNYFKAFETMLNLPRNAQLKTKVDNFVDVVQKYEGMTEEGKARASVSKPKERKTAWDKIKYALGYDKWFDDKHELDKVVQEIQKITGREIEAEKDPYLQARLASTTISNRIEKLIKGEKDPEKRKILLDTLNNFYEGAWKNDVFFQDVIDKANELDEKAKGDSLEAQRLRNYLTNHGFRDWNDALGTYLLANRYQEIWQTRPNYTAPMTKAQAKRMTDFAPKEIKEAAELYYKFDENLLNIMLHDGMLSQKSYDALTKYKAYCPLFRDFADEEAFDKYIAHISAPNAFANIGNGIKYLTERGSDRTVMDDPVLSMMRMTGAIISKCERNKVAQKLVELSVDSGVGGFIKAEYDAEGKHSTKPNAQESVFTVYRHGTQRAYRTTPDLYKVLMGKPDTAEGIMMFVDFLSKPARLLRWGATTDPGFVGFNAIMDTMTAGVTSRNNFIPIFGTLHGLYLQYAKKHQALRNEFELSGASMGNWRFLDKSDSYDTLDEMAGHDPHWTDANFFIKNLKGIYKAWMKINEAVENSNRIEEYYNARRKGKSITQAAIDAKEVTTDYTRAGEYGRVVNRIKPFFNAALQGTDRLVRAVRERPAEVLGKMAILGMAAFVYWLRYHDEDWWKELTDEEKITAARIPYVDANGKTQLLTIPYPHELGVLSAGVTIAAAEALERKDPNMVRAWASRLRAQTMPDFGVTFVQPMLEVVANYDFYFNSPVEAKKYQMLAPEARIGSNTSNLAIYGGKASKAITDVTGLPQLSPIQIDHLIRGYMGRMGTIAAHTLDSENQKPSDFWDSMPIVGAMVNETRKRFIKGKYEHPKSVDDWYALKEELDQYHTTYEKGTKPAYMTGANKLNKEMTKIRKQINAVRQSNLTKERKDQIIAQLDERSIKLARFGVQTYSKYRH